MDNLSKITNKDPHDYKLTANEEGIKKLPSKFFQKALSYLSCADLQELISTSRNWKAQSISVAEQKILSDLQNFTQFLCEKLPQKYSLERNQLLVIGTDTRLLNSVNLIQIKSSALELLDQIANQLKDLKKDDLEDLKKNCNLNFNYFSEVFYLIEIYQSIEVANRIGNEGEKSLTLREIVERLTEQGLSNKAIEVANMIPDKDERSLALSGICKESAEKGFFEKATEVANMIPDKDEQLLALSGICKKLADKGLFEKAIEVANMIPDKDEQLLALSGICKELACKGLFEKAIEIANTIPDEYDQRSFALSDICKELADKGLFEKATEVANKIADEYERSFALREVSKRHV